MIMARGGKEASRPGRAISKSTGGGAERQKRGKWQMARMRSPSGGLMREKRKFAERRSGTPQCWGGSGRRGGAEARRRGRGRGRGGCAGVC